MREIKFRVWYDGPKELAEMIYPDLYWFEEEGIREIPNDYADRYKVMQYTGLKDKHGKEIYEGDIVRINHPHDMTGDFTNAIGAVFWWDEEGGWYHDNGNGRPPKRMWKYSEVIGNIYENPELLEQHADS